MCRSRGDLDLRSTRAVSRGVVAALVVLSLLFAGCGSRSQRVKFKFHVSPEANRGTPVQVGVLVFHDQERIQQFDSLTAGELFNRQDLLKNSDPSQSTYSYLDYELPPVFEKFSYDVTKEEVIPRTEINRALLFANYRSEGRHITRFDPRLAQTVYLGRDGFRIVSGALADAEDRDKPRRITYYTLYGLGAAGVITGIIFAARQSTKIDEMNRLTPNQQDRYNELLDGAETDRNGMLLSSGIGLGLLTIGFLVHVAFAPDKDEEVFRSIHSEEGGQVTLFRW